MTLEQLRMLVAIADTGSVLAAAESLGRTQPTVSMAIRKLEEEFGLQLLARDRYRASLTSAGEKFCTQARGVLQQTEKLATTAGHLAVGHEPELRIAIEASCPIPLALGVLRECEVKFPDTEIVLLGETLWGALERLQAGEVDLAITPWFDENPALESYRLFTTTLVTVASPDFPFLQGDRTLQLADLKPAVQVIVKDSSREQSTRSYGVLDDGHHWYVTDHSTKKEILLAGMGWGRLHRHAIEDELKAGTLVPVPISDYPSTLDVDIHLARRRAIPSGPVAAQLWDDFRQLSRKAG